MQLGKWDKVELWLRFWKQDYISTITVGKVPFFWIMITNQDNTVVQDDAVRAPYGFAGGLTKLPCVSVGFHMNALMLAHKQGIGDTFLHCIVYYELLSK